ncbi:MAG: transcription termination/antitermination protein NusG [Bacteroidaceae bacterium]|nr:transcription termination/antitermination protein NusG [Bacteroidaceae bacterium]
MAENEMRWYVLRAISGKEGKVKEYVDAQVAQGDYKGNVSQVLIPTEKVVSVRNGKRYVKERCHLPGYVLVECILKGETQAMLRNTPNVLGFLGETKASDKPMPVREDEMKRLLGVVDEMADVPEDMPIPFVVGDAVKVTDGPFNGFDAVIEEVNNEKKKLKVSVKIFGRKTPLEVGFMQVAKE